MSSASGRRKAPSRRRLGAFALVAVAIAVAVGGAAAASDPTPSWSVSAYQLHSELGVSAQERLATAGWLGGSFATHTGESVRVLVSEAYPDSPAVGQRWAEFFASLVHGSELSLVTVYVLTPSEMRLFCGPYALGCYGGNELAFIGETFAGVEPEEVAAHEYGHHVAANRLNSPWLAVAWGPKRWASAANICARSMLGTAFPGNEQEHYELNPGEGFAEVFRVLNELKTGATSFSWPLVDSSFSPSSEALQAAELDVVSPWSALVTQVFRTVFTTKGKKVWTVPLRTPFDGILDVAVTLPKNGLHEVVLFDSARKTTLQKGLWSSTTSKRITTTICGERSLVVRVTQKGGLGKVSVVVSTP
ncbi:MAG: hypothetical protein OEW47_07440 [Thermoleophilia bacterium]|nr:hypothetical protein [Thermoleophilia bacterium]